MSSLRRTVLPDTVPIVALAAAAVLLAAGCGGSGSKESASTTAGSSSGRPALDPSKTYTVALKTNQGTFAFDLDVKDSPHTAASFAALVKKGFFDGLTFHRIVPGFVIQGGDPNGDGTGGPGYTTVDAPPADAKYTRGVVAMAKTAAEPPGTAGSQFFVVTGADAGLPPDYALLGKVSSGMDVVDKIGELGDPATEQPTKRVVIEKATVSES
ncbi:MAG: peptidylprolyl isomerase [Verrucomicrobiota bacterium]